MDNTPINPEKCAHYAKFARGLTTVNFDTLYWFLFIFVIMLLFYASTTYDKCIKLTAELPPGSKEHRRHMIRCLAICGLCTAVAIVAVVMETFALLALQFCDGADLMMLYWSTWTMLQVGSVIAIFGVMLAVFHVLRERKPPAWGLALGTPVLVVAGLGHFFHDCVYKRLKNLIPRYRERKEQTVSISQSSTLRAATPVGDEESGMVVARLYGHTVDGGTILQLTGDVQKLPSTDERIGTMSDGKTLIVCGKGSEMARLVAAGPTSPSDRHQVPDAPGGASLRTATTNESQDVKPEPAVAGPSTARPGTSGHDSIGDRAISFQNSSIRETLAGPARTGAEVIQLQDV